MSPHDIQPDRRARRPRPELLAPAGDWDALRAAAAAGADAVYFGLENFNARRRAANFTLAELPQVVEFLHHRNVKGYVTLNTLVFADELEPVAQFVERIAQAGVDAVIVQDLGVICLIRRMVPTLPIHASTQMTQTEPAGIEFLRDLGVSRVILARELSLPEIAQVSRATTVDLEVFVHGALCISFSGQCLASESLFGRSGNRGLCAQVCRLPFELEVDGRTETPSGCQARKSGTTGQEFPLSPRDLALYDRIAELAELGVAGFKIEGRLKNATYVGAVVDVYRSAIDAALSHRPFKPTRDQERALAQSFSRGFSHGFLDGVNHARLVDGRSSKARGTLVGTVVAKSRRGVIVELSASSMSVPLASARVPIDLPVKAGDGVVFETKRSEDAEQGGRIFSVDPQSEPRTDGRRPRSGLRTQVRGPQRAELTFGRDDLNLGAIAVGSRVWKTDDPAVRRRIERAPRSTNVAHRAALRFVVQAAAGEPLVLRGTDETGATAEARSNQPLEAADKHPLTIALLREQLSRLGDTPFELDDLTLLGPSGPIESLPVMAPKSVLNDLRRRVIKQLLEMRAAATRHEVAHPDALANLRIECQQQIGSRADARSNDPVQPATTQLHVLVRTLEQLDESLVWTPESPSVALATIYAEFNDFAHFGEALRRARRAGRSLGFALPRVLMPGEETLLARLADLSPDAYLVRNLGAFCRIRQRSPQAVLIGDFSLNVANDLAAAVLLRDSTQMVRFCPGHDLNWQQLGLLARNVPPDLLEIVLHQHMPLFHTRHCLFAAHFSNGADCTHCGRPCTHHEIRLRDRIGVSHPVLVDLAGRNTVFSARPQTAAEYVPALLQLGLRHFRMECLGESADDARALLDVYAALLAGQFDPRATLDRLRQFSPTGITAGTFAHA